MEAIAKHNKVGMSARKARLVADLVRGMEVEQALAVLKNKPQKANPIIAKVLLSAINNWEQKKADPAARKNVSLYIKEIFVNIGRVLKRIQPAPQGRAHPIRKPSCHINIVVADKAKPAEAMKDVVNSAKAKTAAKAVAKKGETSAAKQAAAKEKKAVEVTKKATKAVAKKGEGSGKKGENSEKKKVVEVAKKGENSGSKKEEASKKSKKNTES